MKSSTLRSLLLFSGGVGGLSACTELCAESDVGSDAMSGLNSTPGAAPGGPEEFFGKMMISEFSNEHSILSTLQRWHWMGPVVQFVSSNSHRVLCFRQVEQAWLALDLFAGRFLELF